MLNPQEVERIVNTLGSDSDCYYVYMLCKKIDNELIPFYIGKGLGDRIFNHDSDIDSDNATKVIVKWGLTEAEAFMAESALINAYSLTHGKETLSNIANGHMSKNEKNNIACTTKARTVEQFLKECAIPERKVTDIEEPVLFVKITNLYDYCKESDSEIYDSCRACWTIAKNRIDKIKYVFALYNSQVVGIYNIKEWKQRKDIDNTYPIFPSEIRKAETEYAMIAKECNSLEEMKQKCKHFTDFLETSEIDEDDDNAFTAWKSRYYFIKNDDNIPDSIAAFKNCMLVKPNGEKFFSGRGNRSEKMYNFDIDSKTKQVKIKETSDY